MCVRLCVCVCEIGNNRVSAVPVLYICQTCIRFVGPVALSV